jgi:hypothetical protein
MGLNFLNVAIHIFHRNTALPSLYRPISFVCFERPQSLSDCDFFLSEPGNTMLGIVQAQRERLRVQKEELETRTEQQEQQLQLLQGEVQHLQQDNVKVGAAGDRDRAAGATAAAAPGGGEAPTAGQY